LSMRKRLLRAGSAFCLLLLLLGVAARGAECFLLACTELPLAVRELGLDLPRVDPTEELAKAAIRFCGYQVKGE